MICGTIYSRVYTLIIKITSYYFNGVCIRIVSHWGTNQGCSIIRGNTVLIKHGLNQ